jgi:hypothetical protein
MEGLQSVLNEFVNSNIKKVASAGSTIVRKVEHVAVIGVITTNPSFTDAS